MEFLSDTHCHLYLQPLNKNIKRILQSAEKNGVRKILVPGVDIGTSITALEISRQNPNFVYPAVGIHPNYSADIGQEDIDKIQSICEHQVVAAVGEIGLDFYRNYSPKEKQIFVFHEMLRIAEELGLPICLHNRDADEILIELLENWFHNLVKKNSQLSKRPGVFHSFSGSYKIVSWAIEHNFLLGISGPITYKKAEGLQEIVKELDLRHLIIESDAPYLTPEPFRGKTNEPGYVRFIAEKIANIKSIDIEKVIRQTSENAEYLFMWQAFNNKKPQ